QAACLRCGESACRSSGSLIRRAALRGRPRTSAAFISPQWLGEAELVTIRIGHMEEPLAPFRVARGGIRAVARREHAGMQRVDVGMIEDDPSPPGPLSLDRLRDQIEIARARPKHGEGGNATAGNYAEYQHPE